jgi:hypothetical protein
VAILDGNEPEQELAGLCDDIFLYFGQGCRSVSHCYLPEGYDFTGLVSAIHRYDHLAQHGKYKNNLDYNLAIQILNKTPHIALSNLLLIENPALISPVSCLYYSYYSSPEKVTEQVQARREEIQCVVTRSEIPGLTCVRFGEAQKPGLTDYADGVDTLAFLQTLNS